jgi:hypothetical protein
MHDKHAVREPLGAISHRRVARKRQGLAMRSPHTCAFPTENSTDCYLRVMICIMHACIPARRRGRLVEPPRLRPKLRLNIPNKCDAQRRRKATRLVSPRHATRPRRGGRVATGLRGYGACEAAEGVVQKSGAKDESSRSGTLTFNWTHASEHSAAARTKVNEGPASAGVGWSRKVCRISFHAGVRTRQTNCCPGDGDN